MLSAKSLVRVQTLGGPRSVVAVVDGSPALFAAALMEQRPPVSQPAQLLPGKSLVWIQTLEGHAPSWPSVIISNIGRAEAHLYRARVPCATVQLTGMPKLRC
jgi:hypothetical protein